jgi:hypothetical protein
MKDDELIIKLDKMIEFYSNRYGKKGVKIDRLRLRLLKRYTNEIEKIINESWEKTLK